MKRTRIHNYDFLRGIAIIMVIGIHTYIDGLAHFNLFLRQFLNCAVPIFLALSGYFIGRKSFKRSGNYIRFLGKQIPRVYVPMLFWSIPWVLLSVKGGADPMVALLKAFIGGMSIFYFIILIIQCYVLTPVIQSTNKWLGGGKYAVVITMIGISLFDYYTKIEGLELSLVQSCAPFPVWILFYVMGVLKAQGYKLPFQTINPLIGVILGIVLCCIHIVWLYHNYHVLAHGLKLSSHIYSYFVVMWLFSDAAREMYNRISLLWMSKWVIEAGRLSFYIYLNHCLIIFVLSVVHIPNLWSLRWLLTIVLSYMLAKLSDRYCPVELKKYIGL